MLAFASSFVAALVLSRAPSASLVQDEPASEQASRLQLLRSHSRAKAIVLGLELAVVETSAIDRTHTELIALASLTIAFDAFFEPQDEGVRSAPASELERRSRCLGLARAAPLDVAENGSDFAREVHLRASVERARVLGCDGGEP